MDLSDAERYAAAALFTLALHSTHVETGVDKNGNNLSESDIAWGCPSEELFDEYLLSQEPLKLPAGLQDIFWGHDCMAHAGLAPRLYAWLKIPRKAWPGLLRMPDLAGNGAGSPEAVEAFVALVRRYSAFLDPELAFTTGQANRLQQRFSMPSGKAATADEEQQQEQQQVQECTGSGSDNAANAPAASAGAGAQAAGGCSAALAAAPSSGASSGSGSSSGGLVIGLDFLRGSKARSTDEGSSKSDPDAAGQPVAVLAGVPAAEAVAAAAASVTAAAMAAAAEAGPDAAADSAACSADSPMRSSSEQQQQQQATGNTGSAASITCESSTSAAFDELRHTVDLLPRAADEGTVVPAATFTPAEHYEHSTSHKAVLAVYELIGGCLSSNSEPLMEPLLAAAAAAREAEGAAAATLARKEQQQGASGGTVRSSSASSSCTGDKTVQPGAAAEGAAAVEICSSSSSSLTKRPSAAWFPADADADDDDQAAAAPSAHSGGSSSSAVAARQDAAAAASKAQQQELSQQQQAAQQGLAVLQWYDARARVSVKRVAHWLRVPWPQVRAFEQMWAAQALSVNPSTRPKYSSGSRAMAYLKVGAAAVGGGALLAVTGGLAAPAIAAGLGAAVTLVHGGAATAAAVAAAAGSTAGTAAVTGLFGAWGASVGGGSARALYGEVKEFGFWDLSASIYTDGSALADRDAEAAAAAAAAAEEAAAASEEKREQEVAAAAADAECAAGQCAAGQAGTADVLAAGVAPAAATAAEREAASQKQQLQPQQQQQQPSFLHRLFSSNQDSNSSGSRNQAAAAAAVAAAAASASATRRCSSTSQPSSPLEQQQQQPKSPSRLWGWGRQPAKQEAAAAAAPAAPAAAVEEEVEQASLQTRYIRLQEEAFSDNDIEEDEQQQQQQQQQQESSPCRAAAASSGAKQLPEASPAAGTGGGAAAASGSPVAAAGASGKGSASLFKRKGAGCQPQGPVHVPLLQTPVNPKHQAEMRIALTIAVNGCCISSMEDYVRPWVHLPSRDCDRFALVWESACLKELGGALVSFIAQQALTQVTQKTIQTFLYTGLVGALALPMTLTTAMKVAFGSKWLVALRRAQAAGKMLAMQLAQGCHGGRPVTLIGCSMGARLVFHTLLELSRLGAHGCVENVILLGAPLSCRPDRWCTARSVVAGRLINGYSVNDWTLGLLYRVHSSSSIWLQAAGIWKVDVPGVENVNLSRLVNGHSDYLTAMDDILEVINMHDV